MNDSEAKKHFLARCSSLLKRMGADSYELSSAESLIDSLSTEYCDTLMDLRDELLRQPSAGFKEKFTALLKDCPLAPAQLLILSVLSTAYIPQELYEKAGINVLVYKDFLDEAHRMLQSINGDPDALTEADLARLCERYDQLLHLETLPEGRKPVKSSQKTSSSICPQYQELRQLLTQARMPYNRGSSAWETARPLLTLLHFSDIHGDRRNLREITQLRAELNEYVNDTVFTGDAVRTSYLSGFDYWKHTPGAEQILMTIGNHDCLNNPYFNWSDLLSPMKTAAVYIEPFVPFWGEGINHADGATYYSKLYADEGMLLIVLDTNLTGEACDMQYGFFTGELDRAGQNDLAVVIAVHDPPVNAEPINCNFCTPYTGYKNLPCGPGLRRDYKIALESFMDEGGQFTVFLGGHHHSPLVLYDGDYPRQRYIIAGSASAYGGTRGGNALRLAGEPSANLANFVTFDNELGLVKIIRAGLRYDSLLRSQKLLVFDYRDGNIIAQE